MSAGLRDIGPVSQFEVDRRVNALQSGLTRRLPDLSRLAGFDCAFVSPSEVALKRPVPVDRIPGIAGAHGASDMVIRVQLSTRLRVRQQFDRVAEILHGLPFDVVPIVDVVEEFAPCGPDEKWTAERIEQLATTLGSRRVSWVYLNDAETYSGYKLHVYGTSVTDVMDIVKRIGHEALRRDVAYKVAPAGLLRMRTRDYANLSPDMAAKAQAFDDRNDIQRVKAATLYLPHRVNVDQDTTEIVRLMAGYGHRKHIPFDRYLANGVSWRFDLYADPGKDITIREAGQMYASASAPSIAVPSIRLGSIATDGGSRLL